MTRTISRLFLPRMRRPKKRTSQPCLAALLADSLCLLIKQAFYWLILLNQRNQAPAVFTQTHSQRGSVSSGLRGMASQRHWDVCHRMSVTNTPRLGSQRNRKKSAHADKKPFLNSRGSFEWKTLATFLSDISTRRCRRQTCCWCQGWRFHTNEWRAECDESS